MWGWAVRSGQGWPLIKMSLEPPVQAAGENHPADLPGGESEEQGEVEPHWATG
jgi:hypothetical protein